MDPYDVYLISQPFPDPYDIQVTIQNGGGGGPILDRVIQLITLFSMTGD